MSRRRKYPDQPLPAEPAALRVVVFACRGSAESPHKRYVLARVRVGAKAARVVRDSPDSAGTRRALRFPAPGAVLECGRCRFRMVLSDKTLHDLSCRTLEVGLVECDMGDAPGTVVP